MTGVNRLLDRQMVSRDCNGLFGCQFLSILIVDSWFKLTLFYLPQQFRDRKDGDRFNLKEYCQTANIVVPAKKGKAIMWYNYELDGNTGWMSHRDDRSLHGGCVVKKGMKYIANNWLPAPENDSAHLISEYFMDPDEE